MGSGSKERTGQIERVERFTRFLIGAGSSLPLARKPEALTFVPVAFYCRLFWRLLLRDDRWLLLVEGLLRCGLAAGFCRPPEEAFAREAVCLRLFEAGARLALARDCRLGACELAAARDDVRCAAARREFVARA